MPDHVANAEAGMDDRRGRDASAENLNRVSHIPNLGWFNADTRKNPETPLGKRDFIR
ncbi:MAG: hypothetical protein ACLGIM_23765 [Alphaproteobacteria bacterium]